MTAPHTVAGLMALVDDYRWAAPGFQAPEERAAVEAYAAEMVAQEREQCAVLAELSHPHEWAFIGAAIRARGANPESST